MFCRRILAAPHPKFLSLFQNAVCNLSSQQVQGQQPKTWKPGFCLKYFRIPCKVVFHWVDLRMISKIGSVNFSWAASKIMNDHKRFTTVQWTLDLRKILGVTKIFLKSRFFLISNTRKPLKKHNFAKWTSETIRMSYCSIIVKCFWLCRYFHL